MSEPSGYLSKLEEEGDQCYVQKFGEWQMFVWGTPTADCEPNVVPLDCLRGCYHIDQESFLCEKNVYGQFNNTSTVHMESIKARLVTFYHMV